MKIKVCEEKLLFEDLTNYRYHYIEYSTEVIGVECEIIVRKLYTVNMCSDRIN